jgi:hypothetical protein
MLETKKIGIVSRRKLLATSLGWLVVGCGENRSIPNAISAIRLAASGGPKTTITRQMIEKIPYASIGAKVGKGPRALLVLGRYDGPDLHWISGDRAALVTRAGRLVKTVGFPRDLRATTSTMTDPLADAPHRLTAPAPFRRTVDVREAESYITHDLDSILIPLGPETITIAEIAFKTIHLRERNQARFANWTFQNDYWVDIYDGFVWKSRQFFARGLPPVDIEVFKPAATRA